MERELNFDKALFIFETVMRVRSTEIDASQYLTIESLTELLSESRSRFLYSRGIKQISADLQGLIVNNLELNIFSLAREREELLFEVGVESVSNDGCDINIKVTRMYDDSLIAKSRQRFVNYDYRLQKITSLNNSTQQALDQQIKATV